jgi:hypothetical protein
LSDPLYEDAARGRIPAWPFVCRRLRAGVAYRSEAADLRHEGDGGAGRPLHDRKQYSFTQDSEGIGEETLNLGFYRQNAMDEILGEAGFEFERIDDGRQFFVYSNRSESPAASA